MIAMTSMVTLYFSPILVAVVMDHWLSLCVCKFLIWFLSRSTSTLMWGPLGKIAHFDIEFRGEIMQDIEFRGEIMQKVKNLLFLLSLLFVFFDD